PGNYYLVTDTWVSDAGDILAGPYHLEANFIPESNEEIPYGAPENPIEVIAFPFNDTRDTQAPAADAWDSYSCAPDTNESGGEFVYKLSLPSGGDLAVELAESPDVDVDIHLLSHLDPDDCLERHNTELSTHLEAGTYYIVVDTWSNGAETFSGTYDLSITFTPDAPSPEGEGTLSSPILVNQFPFVDQRNTQSSESDVFDVYICDPDIDESGNEFIYKIEVPQAGIIQAHLNDISNANVDIDIHLLSDTNAESCLIRGHQDIVFALEAGTYYLVADTWTNSSGEALAGQYELEILFSQAPDLSDFCLVVYGDTRGNSSNDPQPAHRAVTQAMNEQCENTTFVHTGDLVRSGSSTSDWDTFVEIESAIYDNEGILYPVRGNHDGSWNNMMTRLSPLLTETIETSHYTRTLSEHLTLIGLDSERSAEEQASWLEEQLSDAARADHRFVIAFHRPLYPSAGGHAGWSDGKTHWMPIFQQYAGRIVVVSGHNHAMAREKVEGVDFVTSGGGGAPLYSCSLRHEDTKFCANKYGYYVCDAELDCVGYEIDVETGAKIMIDAFEIIGDAN
ncbi:MAG: metallophosphoesterase, partial [Myxococcota bacterium]|nr:metallophosphoesterase [Myxococcota bacterium]